MANSIIQKSKECWVCKTPFNLHLHHIVGGNGRRKISDKNGFVVYLCAYHHDMSDAGVHFNKELDLKLKRTCQSKFEENHSRNEWLKLIGRNYLE